jgi:4-hydroxy-tetrahydrodipicolinate synthase
MSEFTGVLTAMATPFDGDGNVDFAAAAKLATYLLEHGSDGLVVAGSTGEAATLDDGEQIDLLKAVRAEVGEGTLLICGSGTNDTRHSVALTQAADAAGADAMLVVTPYYNKPNPAGMRAHVESIAASTEKPIILYNIPGRTVINVPPEQLADLATIENVRAVKQANNDDLGPIPGLELLAGNDDILLRCLELGGTGGICVASHIVGPRMAQIHNLFKAGEGEAARELNATLEPLFDALTVTTNPIPIKGALQMLGICSERMRLPMVPLDDAQRAVVRDALVQLDLEVVA